jgi:alpha-methylacyl-CoA racemase
MTHRAHDFVAHRLGGDPLPKLLTGGVACYRTYETAEGRFLTVAALEPKFWQRLCELVDLPELIGRQWEPRLPELERALVSRSLAAWLELFDDEDVCVGPVATLEEATSEFSSGETLGTPPGLGEHTDAWRAELGL